MTVNSSGEGLRRTPPDIVERTFVLGERVTNLCKFLKARRASTANTISQLDRAGSAVGALVEEAQGAESRKDVIHKMSVAQKEARETYFWLRKLLRGGDVAPRRLEPLADEARQVKLVLAAIINSAKKNLEADKDARANETDNE